MFDPHDYFDIRHNRAVCPVHGKRDRNLEIKRHKHNDKWIFTCHSHQCSIREIAEAAGFNAGDIYDHRSNEPYVPLENYISTVAQPIPVIASVEVNTCQRLIFINEETGDEIQVPCDSKHCPDCGPYKQKLIKQQLETGLGAYAYITVFSTRAELDKAIERIRKQAQRANTDLLYQSTGDPYLGWILTSNQPIVEGQNKRALKDYIDRILDYWKRGDRIRRSQALGRMSRLTYRTVEQVGTSAWKRLSQRSKSKREIRLEAEIARRDKLIDEIGGWHVWEENNRWVSSISAWRVE